MKKAIIMALTVAMIIGLTACGNVESAETESATSESETTEIIDGTEQKKDSEKQDLILMISSADDTYSYLELY